MHNVLVDGPASKSKRYSTSPENMDLGPSARGPISMEENRINFMLNPHQLSVNHAH